jgi:pilus assembly protein Flp/PilA
MKKLKRFFKKEEGATAIEYALIAALIALVIVAAVTAVGIAVQIPFNTVAGAL